MIFYYLLIIFKIQAIVCKCNLFLFFFQVDEHGWRFPNETLHWCFIWKSALIFHLLLLAFRRRPLRPHPKIFVLSFSVIQCLEEDIETPLMVTLNSNFQSLYLKTFQTRISGNNCMSFFSQLTTGHPAWLTYCINITWTLKNFLDQ